MNKDEIIIQVIGLEGGSAYTDLPNDKGGPTKYGVTQRILAEYCLRKNLGGADVKNLTLDYAKHIYTEFYWDPMKLDKITNWKSQLVLMDSGINRGTPTAAKLAQKVCNSLYRKSILDDDGILGNKSIAAINYWDEDFYKEFLYESRLAYADIAATDPTQIAFLRGWLRRNYKVSNIVGLV